MGLGRAGRYTMRMISFTLFALFCVNVAVASQDTHDREKLAAMSKSDLIELVIRLQDRLHALDAMEMTTETSPSEAAAHQELDPDVLKQVKRIILSTERKKQRKKQNERSRLKEQLDKARTARIVKSLNGAWEWDESKKAWAVQSRKERGNLIRNLRQKIKQVEMLLSQPQTIDTQSAFTIQDKLEVGKIGWLLGRVKIIQMIDSDAAMAEVPYAVIMVSAARRQRGAREVTSLRNIPPAPSIPKTQYADAIIKGFGLGDMTDGQWVAINHAVQVTGTTTYTTVMGAARTVYVLEPFDIKPYIDHVFASKLSPP